MNKKKPLTNQIQLPEYVNVLSGKHFILDDNDILIRKRVKGLTVKPPLYMWNLTKSCYVSSLKPTLNPNVLSFDIKTPGKIELFNLVFTNSGNIEVQKI